MNRSAVLRLAGIAAMIAERDLSRLKDAAAARAALVARLAGLRDGLAAQRQSADAAALHAALVEHFSRWTDNRRAALNIDLAMETARWQSALLAAARSAGRDLALRALARAGTEQSRAGRHEAGCSQPLSEEAPAAGAAGARSGAGQVS